MKKVKSNILEADSKHYIVDFAINISAIFGIFLAQYFQKSLFDSVIGLFLALYIIVSAFQLFKKSFNNLMDHEMAHEEKQIIINIIQNHKMVLGFHDLKTRYAGVKPFIQFHIELNQEIPLKFAHQISYEIEQEILQKFPSAEVIIHPDPDGVEEQISYKD